jgi:hypothetical protein
MEKKLSEKEIRSLISLIDDDSIYETVFEKIVNVGDVAIEFLDQELETSLDVIKTNRLQDAYDTITINSCCSSIQTWKQEDASNLFEGLSILSRLHNPQLDLSYVNSELAKIKDTLWLELNDNFTALEKVRILNNVFFDMFSFSGDTKDFFNPANSFIVDVLKRKKGNPITLSSIYSIIAQSVGIPIYGVNMPRHFITVYMDSMLSHPYKGLQRSNVLFYVNPFGRGEIYNLKEVYNFLNRLNIPIVDDILLPCDHITMVKRSINNLILIYKNKQDTKNEEKFKHLLEALEEA